MKKKVLFISFILSMILGVTGCGNQIPELSEEDMNTVATYSATLLLKYDKNYKSRLLDDEELAKEEEIQKQIEADAKRLAEREAEKEAAKAQKEQKEQADAESTSSGQIQDSVVAKNLADILELNGMSISCNGIDYSNQYPENPEEMVFLVNASKGCKLAVIKLNLANNSGSEQTINLFEKNAKFKMSINGGAFYSAMQMTVLEDEFSAYSGTVANGQHIPLVLLVDLPENECVTVNDLVLSIKYNGDIVKIKIYP